MPSSRGVPRLHRIGHYRAGLGEVLGCLCSLLRRPWLALAILLRWLENWSHWSTVRSLPLAGVWDRGYSWGLCCLGLLTCSRCGRSFLWLADWLAGSWHLAPLLAPLLARHGTL